MVGFVHNLLRYNLWLLHCAEVFIYCFCSQLVAELSYDVKWSDRDSEDGDTCVK